MENTHTEAKEIHMAALSPLIEEILQSGGTVELTVTGSSMWPMLLHRVSRVRLAPVEELRKGDLPLYRRRNGTYVLHRIAAVEADGSYTCCGDNQWHLERGLQREQMVAVVTDFCRKDRWMSGNAGIYRMYCRVWLAIRPLRRLIFGGFKRIKRMM